MDPKTVAEVAVKHAEFILEILSLVEDASIINQANHQLVNESTVKQDDLAY